MTALRVFVHVIDATDTVGLEDRYSAFPYYRKSSANHYAVLGFREESALTALGNCVFSRAKVVIVSTVDTASSLSARTPLLLRVPMFKSVILRTGLSREAWWPTKTS